eukprot:GHVU01113998.1.p5 GENE.GHVU01113998.1~~GHVU01113998.1.p5  ORF type:complete len:108 (+),score=10.43 GHVU01113998.1:387-710(+)
MNSSLHREERRNSNASLSHSLISHAAVICRRRIAPTPICHTHIRTCSRQNNQVLVSDDNDDNHVVIIYITAPSVADVYRRLITSMKIYATTSEQRRVLCHSRIQPSN